MLRPDAGECGCIARGARIVLLNGAQRDLNTHLVLEREGLVDILFVDLGCRSYCDGHEDSHGEAQHVGHPDHCHRLSSREQSSVFAYQVGAG